MKKKGFCFKRAVALLLAAVMIVTAAPQTGLTVFATELSDINGEGSDSAVDEGSISTPETGDGQEASGNGSEIGGDILPEESGDKNTPDDTEEGKPGNTEEPEEGTEPAEEQEGDGEDTGDIVSGEESVSENTLGVELLAAGDAPEEEEPAYNGEVVEEEDGSRLVVSVDEAGSEQKVIDILKARKTNNESFQCVELDMKDTGPNSRKIKKNILNAAVAVLDEDGWIDYNFYNDSTEEWRNFSLSQPRSCGGDINVNVTMTPVAGLGVKLNFPVVSFPAEHVSLNIGGDNMAGTLAASLDGAGDDGEWVFSKYSLFTLASGKPAAYVSGDEFWVRYTPAGIEDSDGKNIEIDNISASTLKAKTEYLMAPVADDEEPIAAGGTKKLEMPGGTNAAWKSYTPDIVSIDASGTLSAWDEGQALYSVTYQEGTVWKAKFYRMQVGRALSSMSFLQDTVTMEPGWTEGLQLNYYPSDAGCNQEDPAEINWKIDPENSDVVAFVLYDDNGKEVSIGGHSTGEIRAMNPGTATVTATYVPSEKSDNPITAECKITVKASPDWDKVKEGVENLYAVSGCDTKLSDVGLPQNWEWVNSNQSLTPFAGMDGHEFAAIYTNADGSKDRFSIWVRMINLKGIVMMSWQPKEVDEESGEEEENQTMEWVDWIPGSLAEGDELQLSFGYDLENFDYENVSGEEAKTVLEKLQTKYEIEWSSNPKDQLQKVVEDSEDSDPMTRRSRGYKASILGTGKNYKAEKKTFTVSLKDKTVKKKPVVFKASHTLTVTTKPLFDWGKINYWENWENGKVTSLTFMVDDMPPEDYKKQKLTFASMDTSILQLNTKKITEAKPKDEEGNEIADAETTEVTIPCTQKSFGRVWIKVTAPDEMKSSELFCVELPDIQPKIVGAATQTINKASDTHTVPIYMSTHEQYPLVAGEDDPLVSIETVTIKGNKSNLKDSFALTGIKELSGSEAAAILSENGETDIEPYIGLYGMELGLREDADLSRLKAGDYTVKLACTVQGRHEGSEPEPLNVSLTVKVTDVKPKVTFKQTGKVNLFYKDDEGAGTLQVNTTETITKLELKEYKDAKKPKNDADCHYIVKQKTDENGDWEGDYEIVRKYGAEGDPLFNEKLKKGILEYTVEGYTGTFQTTFTVATENKAPAIVLSTKSDMLYPNVRYSDSWISMTDKATGDSFVPDKATYYVGKGKNRVDTPLTIDGFNDEDPEEQKSKEKEITGSASKNTYGLFVTDDGNIVSRLRGAEKYGNKADTINLELKKDNWSKPVAVSYKLQVDSTQKPKLALGKATLTLNKNADIYRGQQERTTLRLKGCGNYVMQGDESWVSITGQDEKSKKALKGNNSSLVIWYWDERGDVCVRFNDNKIDAGTYKFKISVGNDEAGEFASTVLTVKIVDKTVKQSLKVTAKGSIDVLNREGTFISYTPKISNMTGTVEDGGLEGRDADLFDWYFEDGKLIVKAQEGRRYSTKNTYEVHTVFWVQTEDWRGYEISSDNDPKAKPFSIKVKQGKPTLKATTNGNTIYRQLENRVDIRIEAMLGKQEVEIEDVWLLNYQDDLELIPTWIKVENEEGNKGGGEDGENMEWSDEYLRMAEEGEYVTYNPKTKSVRVALSGNPWELQNKAITKNGTYKVKFAVRYRDKAGDAKEAEVTCPIVVR